MTGALGILCTVLIVVGTSCDGARTTRALKSLQVESLSPVPVPSPSSQASPVPSPNPSPNPSPRPSIAPTDAQICSSNAGVFCSGFEEGSFSIWDDFDGNPAPGNTLVSDPGPFNQTGNRVARLLPPSGRGGVDLVKVLPRQENKLYARWYKPAAGIALKSCLMVEPLHQLKAGQTARKISGSTAPKSGHGPASGTRPTPIFESTFCG